MSSDGIKWQPIEGLSRRKRKEKELLEVWRVEGEGENEKVQTVGCVEHMRQRNYAEQRELKSLSYFGIL